VININQRDLFTKVVYVLFVLFLAYLIFELIRKILGGSLGFEELVIALLVANLGYIFHIKETQHKSSLNIKESLHQINTKIENHLAWHKGKEQ